MQTWGRSTPSLLSSRLFCEEEQKGAAAGRGAVWWALPSAPRVWPFPPSLENGGQKCESYFGYKISVPLSWGCQYHTEHGPGSTWQLRGCPRPEEAEGWSGTGTASPGHRHQHSPVRGLSWWVPAAGTRAGCCLGESNRSVPKDAFSFSPAMILRAQGRVVGIKLQEAPGPSV